MTPLLSIKYLVKNVTRKEKKKQSKMTGTLRSYFMNKTTTRLPIFSAQYLALKISLCKKMFFLNSAGHLQCTELSGSALTSD